MLEPAAKYKHEIDRLLINQILEVYRDLKNINTHEEIQIILDRVEE